MEGAIGVGEDPLGSGAQKRENGSEGLGSVVREGTPVTHRLSWLSVLSTVTLSTILALQG